MNPRIEPAEDPRAKPLRRMKTWAVSLLLLAIAGLVLSHWMGARGPWAWARAFCEAAAVGALADWFAVVALFKRPLGLPIPHTAIIPNSKGRIADSLAAFVRDHFLEPEALLSKLSVFDPAARLGQWISQPAQARRVSQSARAMALEAIDLLDEAAVRQAIHRFVVARAQAWDAASVGSEVLQLLTRDGRHQEMLNAAMLHLGNYLGNPETRHRLATLMVKHARTEWPKIIKAVNLVKSVDDLGDNLADRLALALIHEMREVMAEPDHPVRLQYEDWLQGFIERLKEDPTLVDRVNDIKLKLIEHPAVLDYVNGLWAEVHAALKRDLAQEDSALGRHVERALLRLGRQLSEDQDLREAINAHVLSAADRLSGTLRSTLTSHIATTVKAWDERRLVEQVALSVGRDLQFIRINGTVVGGVVGLVLHALMTVVLPMLR